MMKVFRFSFFIFLRGGCWGMPVVKVFYFFERGGDGPAAFCLWGVEKYKHRPGGDTFNDDGFFDGGLIR